MKETIIFFLTIFNKIVLSYYLCYALIYIFFVIASINSMQKERKKSLYRDNFDIVSSKYAFFISILVPCFNEENSIVQNVKSIMNMDYQDFEVIVINDGSKDSSLDTMIENFKLIRTDLKYSLDISCKEIRGVYLSLNYPNLLVVDKLNGGKADALNAGINVSRGDLITTIDADSILERNSLSLVVEPFVYKENVVASCGIVRVANGSTIKNGFLEKVKLQRKYITTCQVLEYIRAFLNARSGFSLFNGLIIISGAFGVFRKDTLVNVGGYTSNTVGEDLDLVIRIHKYYMRNNKSYSIEFVPYTVCWTEAPSDMKSLFNQRTRWHKGLIDAMFGHFKMFLNPKYKIMGLIVFPYYFIFEMFRPIMEVLGILSVTISTFWGLLNFELAVAIVIFSILFAISNSLTAVFCEKLFFERYEKLSDYLWLTFISSIEIFFYRQLVAFDCLYAMLRYKYKKNSWGHVSKKGW